MDQNSLRLSLEELIDREFELVHCLGQALANEHEALQQLDPGALDRATDAKHQCVTALSDVEAQRRQFCTAARLTPDRDGMLALVTSADGGNGVLAGRWLGLLALLEACREANQRNGAVVNLQRRRVGDALGLLHGAAASATVYDAHGEIAGATDSRVHAET